MKRTIIAIVVVTGGLSAWLGAQEPVSGQAAPEKAVKAAPQSGREADERAIRDALEQYVKAMRDRDVPAMQGLLSPSMIGVEAYNEGSKVWIIDSSKPEQLLPPQGNDKWQKVTFSDIDVHISPTHPSVAMVSFAFAFAIGEKEANGMQALLADTKLKLSDEQRSQFEKTLQNKSMISSMFALLAKNRGQWKIVSMTLPK